LGGRKRCRGEKGDNEEKLLKPSIAPDEALVMEKRIETEKRRKRRIMKKKTSSNANTENSKNRIFASNIKKITMVCLKER